MPNCKDATVQFEQPSGPDTFTDQVPTQSKGKELPPGYDAMLPFCHPANFYGRSLPWCNAFGGHFAPKTFHRGWGDVGDSRHDVTVAGHGARVVR